MYNKILPLYISGLINLVFPSFLKNLTGSIYLKVNCRSVHPAEDREAIIKIPAKNSS